MGCLHQWLHHSSHLKEPLIEVAGKSDIEPSLTSCSHDRWPLGCRLPGRWPSKVVPEILEDVFGGAGVGDPRQIGTTVPGVITISVAPGDEVVAVDHDVARIGLTICYDLRFPELYRLLTAQGAELILVPSAFFLETGKDHWLPLLRARAIENQVYLAAPAQWGWHYGRRSSFGQSVLIDPWGTVLASAPEQTGLISGTLDLARLRSIRERLPSWQHRRLELYPAS
ncbi:hypothetical protein EBU58_14885 [bacterium]|nr:hypothetical protein [bacterium]